MSPTKTPTGLESLHKRTSFKITAGYQPAQSSQLRAAFIEDLVECYSVTSKDLRTWLEKRFEPYTFAEDSIKLKGDKWVIMVPEKLSDEEKQEISDLAHKDDPQSDNQDY